MHLLVKNVVEDFDRWLPYFQADLEAARAHGLTLERLWVDPDDGNAVFFLMNAETREGGEAFMARPESADAGQKSGVTGGWAQFLEELPG